MSILKHFISTISKRSISLNRLQSSEIGHRKNGIYSLSHIKNLVLCYSYNGKISIHTTSFNLESELAKLRKKTGYAFSMCRKALELHNQDLAKAEKWLRAEAIKQGWEKAERVKSRNTGEGLVGIYTAPDRTHATMVEVKCETDFVAKNENFIELVTKLAERLSQQTMHQSADIRDTTVSINKLWIVDEKKLNEISGQIITETISKLGENIRFVRGCIIRIQKSENQSDNTPVLLPYTHSVAGKIDSKDSNVILGKYGTIIAIQKKQSSVEVKPSSSTEEDMIGVVSSSSIEEVGSKLGQHIIGLSPLSILPPDSAESADIENVNGDEEPTALMKQKFIFNDEITVEQFLNNSQANILDFVRFECGEELQSN